MCRDLKNISNFAADIGRVSLRIILISNLYLQASFPIHIINPHHLKHVRKKKYLQPTLIGSAQPKE